MNLPPSNEGLGNLKKLSRQLKDEPATLEGKDHGEDETAEAETEHTDAETANLQSRPRQTYS